MRRGWVGRESSMLVFCCDYLSCSRYIHVIDAQYLAVTKELIRGFIIYI